MFAVFKTGGKQYKAAKNEVLRVEKLEASVGDVVIFDQVLAMGEGAQVKLGAPLLSGLKVSAEVLEQKKDDKVVVFKKLRRHNYRRRRGHRQFVTVLRIQDIGENLSAKIAPKKAVAEGAAVSEAKKPAAAKKAAKKAE